jgi:DnaJ-class molecular chaperone
MGGNSRTSSFEFDFGDLFGDFWWWNTRNKRTSSRKTTAETKEETLDFEKTYEVPVFDLILWAKIEVTGVYWQKAKLTIPAKTKPGTKFRVKDFWKSEGTKKWNLIIKIEAAMPKIISDVDLQMLKTIRDNVGY